MRDAMPTMTTRAFSRRCFNLGLGSALACQRVAPSQPPASAPADLALVGLDLVSVNGGSDRREHTILIVNDEIGAVGPSATTPIPPRTTTVRLPGAVAIAGLVDMHGHPPDAEPDDTWSMELYLALQLAAGVTTIRSMRGTPAQLVLRDAIADGEVIGPRLRVGGLVGDVGAEGARVAVGDLTRAGYDFVKLTGGVDLPAYRALVQACATHRMRLAGHVPQTLPLREVLDAHQGIEHLHGYAQALAAGESIADLAGLTAASGIVNCPTLEFPAVYGVHSAEQLRARDELTMVPKSQRAAWETWLVERDHDPAALARAREAFDASLQVLAALAAASAPLGVSPSHGPFIVPGASMRREMEHFRRAGLDNPTILRAAVGDPGPFFGEPRLGRIEAGARADIVVLASDPRADLDTLSQPLGVLAAGSWHPRAQLLARVGELLGREA